MNPTGTACIRTAGCDNIINDIPMTQNPTRFLAHCSPPCVLACDWWPFTYFHQKRYYRSAVPQQDTPCHLFNHQSHNPSKHLTWKVMVSSVVSTVQWTVKSVSADTWGGGGVIVIHPDRWQAETGVRKTAVIYQMRHRRQQHFSGCHTCQYFWESLLKICEIYLFDISSRRWALTTQNRGRVGSDHIMIRETWVQ